MVDELFDGKLGPGGEIRYDATQRPMRADRSFIDSGGWYHWVNQGDLRPRVHHPPARPRMRMIERVCLSCARWFALLDDSKCPACGYRNSVNSGEYPPWKT